MKAWSKKIIVEIIDYYCELLGNSDNKKIEETLISLNELIDFVSFNPYELIPLKERLDSYQNDDYIYLENNSGYIPFFRKFDQEIEYIPLFKEKLEKIKLTTKDLLEYTKDFYHNTDLELESIFNNIYSSNDLYVNFKKNTININGNVCYGYIFPISNTKIIFSNITDNKTISTLLTLIHEFAHMIAFYINDKHMKDINKMHFSEIEGLFMELVASNFIKRNLGYDIDLLKVNARTYNDHLTFNHYICTKLDIYNELSKNELNSKKAIKNYILGNHKLLRSDLSYIYYGIIEDYAGDVISYLTAVEVYLIYLQDKKSAFEILKRIIKLNDMSSEDYLKSVNKLGIKIGSNINKYLTILKEEEEQLHGSKKILYRY